MKIFRICLCALAIFIAILAVKAGYQTGEQVTYPVAYSEYIYKYAKEYDLDPHLVMAVIKVESNFVPEAQSEYAGGLMQLTAETAQWNADRMGITYFDYMDPETNIKLGCHYLNYLINNYDTMDTALAAYNGGMGNVNKWLSDARYSSDGKNLDNIPFPETKSYVVKVNEAWIHYKENF